MRRIPALLIAAVTVAPTIGCMSGDDYARKWMAEMDARPPDQQVPNWASIRTMMLREAPAVGDPAPDFALKTRDGERTVRLSAYRGKKPVVLIFGSWT